MDINDVKEKIKEKLSRKDAIYLGITFISLLIPDQYKPAFLQIATILTGN